jgi:hypothetical protein
MKPVIMVCDHLWDRLRSLEFDLDAARWALVFVISWFVGWTGLILYSGTELVPTLTQGAVVALTLGVFAYLIRRELPKK